MLSSVANRFYWCGRYLERAENTARLINVYTQLLLDLPPEAGVTMRHLVLIAGTEDLFDSRRRWPLETSVVRFMASDTENPTSILTSLNAARENLRTLRDIVPAEGFQAANELYLAAGRKLVRAPLRRFRFRVLSEIIEHCQMITGLFAGTMSHGDAYHFLRLGRNLERADMTTRILDVAGELQTAEGEETLQEYETTLWVNVLRSLSAYQAYRQSVRSRITPVRVLYFVVADRLFPRSLAHCLGEIEAAARMLPQHEEVVASVDRMREVIESVHVRALASSALHEHMDRFQLELGVLHDTIHRSWFGLAAAPVAASRTA